jgi:hypothetical protein
MLEEADDEQKNYVFLWQKRVGSKKDWCLVVSGPE